MQAFQSFAPAVLAEIIRRQPDSKQRTDFAWAVAVGPALAETLFDGGLRRAQTAQAIANYDANVAAYRETVLAGFAEVEDQLASLRILEQESDAQDDALASARESLALTLNQYKAGTVSYLNVVTVQATALASERNAVAIFGSRMIASVGLVRALGGGS